MSDIGSIEPPFVFAKSVVDGASRMFDRERDLVSGGGIVSEEMLNSSMVWRMAF